MSIPTLTIGLGGTGVLAVRALKKLYQGLPDDDPPGGLPKEERVPASFLALDFDRSALYAGDAAQRFADLDEDEFFYLNPKGIQEMLLNLDRGENGGLAWEKVLQWFPDRARIQIPPSEVEANGASQLRVLGRIGFFLNDQVIERMLRLKLNDLGSEVDPHRLAEDKRVVIVSSIAGGTGAGMLVDMCYVARRQLMRPRVFAYVLLPEVFQDVDSGGRIYQNAYACLKELAYLKDQQIPFDAEYERIPPIHVPVAGEEPMSRIFLCRGDGFAGAESIKSAVVQIANSILGQLQRTIQEKTLAIASNTLSADPLEEQRKRRTHCFSTVTSSIFELEKVDTGSVIFEMIVEALKDDRKLEEIYQDNVHATFERLVQEFEPNPAAPAAINEKREEERAKAQDGAFIEVVRLVREWGERIDLVVPRFQPALLGKVQSAIASAEAAAHNGREGTDLKAVLSQLEELTQLPPMRKGVESPTDVKFERLTDVQAVLDTFDKEILGILDPLSPEAEPTTEQALKRRTYYSQLLRLEKAIIQAAYMDVPENFQNVEMSWSDGDLGGTPPKRGWWGRTATLFTHETERLKLGIDSLSKVFSDPFTAGEIATFLKLRAREKVFRKIREFQAKLQKVLDKPIRAWTERKHQSVEIQKQLANLGHLRPKVVEWLGERFPKMLDETSDIYKSDEPPEQRRKKLEELVYRHLKTAPDLIGPHYRFDKNPEEVEDFVREQLVRARQQIFERRTPNPQRKGIALIMIPEGLIWPRGSRQALRRFLEASASQILASRVQVEDYKGSRIWIYYEDLFNPPEHVRHIDEYYRTYKSQQFKELFHIDRRFFNSPVFDEIVSRHTTITITCGNPGCRENISGVPRTEHICPGCGKMIRNRCGNENCTENDLSHHPKGRDKSCPGCGGFNHGAWWCCTKHGKVAVEVPIDKDRCPTCIAQHHEDPVRYPESGISVRPDLKETLACPHCEVLHKKDKKHPVFRIARDLRRFYLHGVNGHDRIDFAKLARRYNLPDDVRCPSCRTFLIPVHHQRMTPTCGGSAS